MGADSAFFWFLGTVLTHLCWTAHLIASDWLSSFFSINGTFFFGLDYTYLFFIPDFEDTLNKDPSIDLC